MRWGFYPKLALDGMRKNRRLYLPYLFTGAGMVAMYYILVFLEGCEQLTLCQGEATVRTVLELGTWVLALFSILFLFYTNSFLMRRRKKEFGLYNILGMGKGHLGIILFWETVFAAVFSILVGLGVGVLLSKAAELGMVRILRGAPGYDFSVSLSGLLRTAVMFGPIFLLLYLNSLRQLWFSSALSLLRSENTGEKPPRANWFLGILGVVLLGAAYYLAVAIDDPLTALVLFFIAVGMVILATYLLMIAGSVVLCRILQKNKRYYYKANHFISVSSMAYRMKRNGAGLASICILATMVLVMLSSTMALYFGGEDALNQRFPREINLTLYVPDAGKLQDTGELRERVDGIAARYGVMPQNVTGCRRGTVSGLFQNGVVETDPGKVDRVSLDAFSDLVTFNFVSLEDYNAISGTREILREGEALACSYRTGDPGEWIMFNNGPVFHVKGTAAEGLVNGVDAMSALPTITLVVSDLEKATAALASRWAYNGEPVFRYSWECNFDTGLPEEQESAMFQELKDMLIDFAGRRWDRISYSIGRRNAERDDFYGTFGGFFYLGILLSIVFLFATVLIIYYKQISEGYEDQSRFELMQKVGLTRQEIRKSVNSQLLTVFFLPLLGAGLHMAFAFPMVHKLLLLFNLNNAPLFMKTTGLAFLLFAVFYLLVYRGTSNVYYGLVSGSLSRSR